MTGLVKVKNPPDIKETRRMIELMGGRNIVLTNIYHTYTYGGFLIIDHAAGRIEVRIDQILVQEITQAPHPSEAAGAEADSGERSEPATPRTDALPAEAGEQNQSQNQN